MIAKNVEKTQQTSSYFSSWPYRSGSLAQVTPDAQANGWSVIDGHANILESGNEAGQTIQRINPPSEDDPVMPLGDGLFLLLIFSVPYIIKRR